MGLRQPSPASQPSPIWIASSAKLAIHASQPRVKKSKTSKEMLDPNLEILELVVQRFFF